MCDLGTYLIRGGHDIFLALDDQEQSTINAVMQRMEERAQNPLFDSIRHSYLEQLDLPSVQTFLDLGCGTRIDARAAARWPGFMGIATGDLVTAPRRSTPEMQTLTAEEAARLLIAAQGDPLEAFYVTALTTGLRLGELQALQWRSVDLDRRRLRVVANVRRHAGR